MENIKYEKFDYETYKKRLASIDQDQRLIDLGMEKRLIGKTAYNYALYDYVIGHGQKDLFIVGGTHGSEIIGVDFVTQLMNQIPNFQDYDPNLVTLHIIPNLNPEGFDMTTSTLQGINNENLRTESFDYYLRYRTDNVVNAFLNNLNSKLTELSGKILITPTAFLNTIKSIFSEKSWLNLCANNAIPGMKKLEDFINRLPDYNDLYELMRDMKIGLNFIAAANLNDPYLCSALKRMEESLFSDELWFNIVNKNDPTINRNTSSRLYQERFQNAEFKGTQNPNLASDIADVYQMNNIPLGSQVKFDPTGRFINLNENTYYNPGIEVMQNGGIVYGATPANNIINYADGPIGKPTEDPYNFTFAKENAILNDLFAESVENHRFAGALLYHGTGGLVYSKPYQTPENMGLTNQILEYNDALSDAYKNATGYKQVERADNTGYGDLMRQTYPGVLLIELSKMGGNPIAPYGDPTNIETVMHDNFKAVNDLIARCNELINAEVNIEPTSIIR